MYLFKCVPRAGAGLAIAAMLAAGCASVPDDLGADGVRSLAADRGLELVDQPDAETRRLVEALLSEPLGTDDAVSIALLQNPRLHGAYARLGLAAADVYAAGRLSNPRLSVAWLDSDDAGAVADQFTLGLSQSFTDLLLLKARSGIAAGEFERAQQTAAGEILALAADAQAAWFELAGALQITEMRAAVVNAAEAAAELAERYFRAGNISHLELALERAEASQARLALLDARARVTRERARLNRVLALPAGTGYEIADGLPEPREADEPLETFVALSFRSRLDLAAQTREMELAADTLGLSRRYRWLGAFGDVTVGAERERETTGSTLRGPTLGLEIPLFNRNADAVTRAEARLALAEAELTALRIDIDNAVRLAHAELHTARERLREHADALVPLREEIVARTQEQVNFMLLGPFELLRAQRQEYDAYQGYLEAVRDYWLARVDLGRSVGTLLPVHADAGSKPIGAEALTGQTRSGARPEAPPPGRLEPGITGTERHDAHRSQPAPNRADREVSPHAAHGDEA